MQFNLNKRPENEEDWRFRAFDAMEAFSPGAPIDDLKLLAGRGKQIGQMLDTVMQRGQHAILYGERGVGKSSLANTFSTKLIGPRRTISCIAVNCDPSDNFTRLWQKIFRRLVVDGQNLAQKYPNQIFPDDIVTELATFSLNTTPIIILDEFDKLEDQAARNLVANTVKNLSDHSVRATIILVGVGDSVDELIQEHKSVGRCLRQIHMQRMFTSELKQIITDRLPALGMDIQPEALAHIVALSRGLPHYTHLLGQQSAKKALEGEQLIVDIAHVERALPGCVEQTAQTVRGQYHKATHSPRPRHIYREVLLAAALAQVDELGYFAPSALKKPLTELLGQEAPVSLFGQHLKILCDVERGEILEQTGSERRYRYRFVDPMMQPFILMSGLREKRITREQVNQLAASHYEPQLSTDF